MARYNKIDTFKNYHYDITFYNQILDNYIQTGECPSTDDKDDEPLFNYLISIMKDPLITFKVLNDDVCARLFYDSLLHFIVEILDSEHFNFQRSQSEREGMKQALEWSKSKRENGWQALLQMISDKYENLFDTDFWKKQCLSKKYEDPQTWQKMINDWEMARLQNIKHSKQQSISQKSQELEKNLRSHIDCVPDYLKKKGITKDEFKQSWGLMGGIWNTVEFERIREIVHLQQQYPEITKIANIIGRVTGENSSEQVFASGGTIYPMLHSAKNDIFGVTIGNDLNALMPIELTNYADEKLENLFFHKYLTKQLQLFRYKSEIMKPNRQLNREQAHYRGPIIICLDTSSSMMGKPEKIANSLLIKLLEIANKQKRDCFLIAFSVSAYPIDIKKEKNKILDFFRHSACGDTNATMMLQTTFQLLHNNQQYINADVLWISDFMIPLAPSNLIDTMKGFRNRGTHFYGLQIGTNENLWLPYFDRIYKTEYTPNRIY
jgi:uncharacterized protein with von Willebrand factor type A (vWA) domain